MKLYRISTSNKTVWAGSQAEAATARKHLTDAGVKRADIETETVEVPTDKQGLLKWLNEEGV